MKPFLESDGGDRDDKNIGIWRSSSQNEYVHIKFDFQITQRVLSQMKQFQQYIILVGGSTTTMNLRRG